MTRKAWNFFAENAGGIVGERALGAAALARAEERLEAAVEAGDVRVVWEWDDSYDDSWMTDAERKEEHEWTQCAIVRDVTCSLGQKHTEYLASLGGIVDADSNYRRVVEAELALEAHV